MPEITFNQAKEFLDKISFKDKVLIIHHNDLDGYSSAILFYDFCRKKGAKIKTIAFANGENQQKVVKQIKEFNKIIITDLPPNTISEILEYIKNKKVLYTDHHQKDIEIPESILEYRTTKNGYIPSSRTAYELSGGKEWLAVAGTISDMGHFHEVNKNFIENFLKKIKTSRKKYLESVVSVINKFLIYFNEKRQKVFYTLLKVKNYKEIKKLKKYARPIEKEIQKYIKEYKKKKEKIGEINFYYFNPKYKIKSIVASQISFLYKEDLVVFAGPDKEKIRLSARTQNKKGDMIKVLKKGINGLKNASAGGHIPAAGGYIQRKDLKKFKENLKKYKMA